MPFPARSLDPRVISDDDLARLHPLRKANQLPEPNCRASLIVGVIDVPAVAVVQSLRGMLVP